MRFPKAAPLVLVICFAIYFQVRSPAGVVLQIGQNFTGSTFGIDSFAVPPDADGAIGPAHFVEFINGRFSVYDKRNGKRVQSMDDRQFWAAAGVELPSNVDISDPRLLYDPASQRWFACGIDFDNATFATNRFLVAVSSTLDPTKAWNGFAFAADPVNGNFADFPTLGLNSEGVYLSAWLFDLKENALGPNLVALSKSALISVAPSIAGRTSFGMLDETMWGEVIQPVMTLGASTTGEIILSVSDVGTDFQPHSSLIAGNVSNVDSTGQARLSNPVVVNVPAYNVPINPPQPNGQSDLDNGDSRFSSTVYQVGDVIYAVHSTEIDGRAALQWFRIDATGIAPVQSGIISDPNLDLFYPSIAANPAGAVVIAFNGCSATSFIGAYATVGMPDGRTIYFGALQQLIISNISYSHSADGVNRWGDYSTTSLDPNDPNRFWTIQTYPSSSSAWSTQITELIVTENVPGITLQPSRVVVTVGQTASFTVAVESTSPVIYQWQKDGNPVPGATNATLTILNVQTTDSGNYSVTASNASGSVTSQPAALVVTSSGLRVSVGSGSGRRGAAVVLPIQVSGFQNLLSFQLSFHWNPAVAQFASVTQFGFPDLGAGNFSMSSVSNGVLAVSWSDPTGHGVTLPEGGVLFAMGVGIADHASLSSSVTVESSPLSLVATNLQSLSIPITAEAGNLRVEGLAQIAGRVKYYQTGIGVPGVTLMLSGDDTQTVTSAADGSYGFTVCLGSNYVVTPTVPNDPAPNQGVTTLDIVLIRRHILGIGLLDSPYKIIAADANGSKTITTLDLALIRRLILAVTNNLPIGTLWQFLPANQAFSDPQIPWGYATSLSFSALTGDQLNQDFSSIKLGDVRAIWTPLTTGLSVFSREQSFFEGKSDMVSPGTNQ